MCASYSFTEQVSSGFFFFNISAGFCTAGPAEHAKLTIVPVVVVHWKIWNPPAHTHPAMFLHSLSHLCCLKKTKHHKTSLTPFLSRFLVSPPGHLHRSRPHGAARAPHESHQRRLQKVQGERPVQEAGGHTGGPLPLTLSPLFVVFVSLFLPRHAPTQPFCHLLASGRVAAADSARQRKALIRLVHVLLHPLFPVTVMC